MIAPEDLDLSLSRVCARLPGVRYASAATDGRAAARDALLGAELISTASMGERRLAEFIGGRVAARSALAGLGAGNCEIPVGPAREPTWPDGYVGSITHADGAAAAVAGRRAEIRSVGIDLEAPDGVEVDLWESIATARELELLHGLPMDEAMTLATVLFSAKEAAYKCQFPLTGRVLEFRDACVSIAPTTGRFSVGVTVPSPDARTLRFEGRYVVTTSHVLTLAWAPAESVR